MSDKFRVDCFSDVVVSIRFSDGVDTIWLSDGVSVPLICDVRLHLHLDVDGPVCSTQTLVTWYSIGIRVACPVMDVGHPLHMQIIHLSDEMI